MPRPSNRARRRACAGVRAGAGRPRLRRGHHGRGGCATLSSRAEPRYWIPFQDEESYATTMERVRRDWMFGTLIISLLNYGCSDHSLTKGSDTGIVIEVDPIQDCYNLYDGYQVDYGLFSGYFPDNSWDDQPYYEVNNNEEQSQIQNGGLSELVMEDLKISGVEIKGMYNSLVPATTDGSGNTIPYTTRLVAIPFVSAYPYNSEGTNKYSIEVFPAAIDDPEEPDVNWVAEMSSNEFIPLNSCHPDCGWVGLIVEIQDPETPEDPDAAHVFCDKYVPRVDVCFDYIESSSSRFTTTNSQCGAGSGRFQLIPRRLYNRDDDDSVSVILRPIQKSGSGSLTGSAWIRKISMVEDQELPVRVALVNQNFQFDDSDSLVQASLASDLLEQGENTYPMGAVSGGAPFILEEVPKSTSSVFEVDLEWECGVVMPTEEVTPSPGYTFALSDFSCSGGWPQQFTIRPTPYLSPTHLDIELYGQYSDRKKLVLDTSGNEYSFSYELYGLKVAGKLLSYDGSGASLQMDEISWSGVPLCNTGVYTILPEQ